MVVEIVEKQLEYYNENDLDNFVLCFSEDIEVYNFGSNELRYKGRDEMKKRYKKGFEVDKTYAHLENRIVIGNRVIDHERVSKVTSDSIKYAVAIYEVEDNIIKKVWFM